VLERYGILRGQPAHYYRDSVLSVLFMPAIVVAISLAEVGRFDGLFISCVGLSVACWLLARTTRLLVLVTVGFVGFRFAFSFLLTLRPLMLVAAIVCGLLVWLLLHTMEDGS
jgi:hypothetical protein